MTNFKSYYASTMRFGLFLYTNKGKITIVATIALFLTPNVVCEKQHNVILNKNRLFFNPSVLILKTLYLSRSIHPTCLRCLLLILEAESIRIFLKVPEKVRLDVGFMLHLTFSPCQFYRQLEAILQSACL